MKIRTDFVTNSSSSSFILAFRDDEDYSDFLDKCDWFEYPEFSELIESAKKRRDADEMKVEAEEFLYNVYMFAARREVLKKKFENTKFATFTDELRQEQEFQKTEEYKTQLEEILSKTDLDYKMNKLKGSEIVIPCEIWDTNGGLLEWAIRNGFVEDNFYEWCLCSHNVG